MIEFIFIIVLMFSLSGVLYLMVRALPRIAEVPGESSPRGFLDRWAHSELPEKIDESVNGFLLKFLRKLKVSVLKLDNALSAHLRKIHSQENEKKSNIDFKEISGKGTENTEDQEKI